MPPPPSTTVSFLRNINVRFYLLSDLNGLEIVKAFNKCSLHIWRVLSLTSVLSDYDFFLFSKHPFRTYFAIDFVLVVMG